MASKTVIEYSVIYYEKGKKYRDYVCRVSHSKEHVLARLDELKREHPEFEDCHIERRTATYTDWEREG